MLAFRIEDQCTRVNGICTDKVSNAAPMPMRLGQLFWGFIADTSCPVIIFATTGVIELFVGFKDDGASAVADTFCHSTLGAIGSLL